MYEQLKTVPDRTGIQERLVLIVHLKQKQIKMREMEIYVLGAMTEDNGKQLKSAIDSYRRLMFPGVKDGEGVKDAQLERAKKMLAQEVDKVFLVRPIQPGEGLPQGSIRSPDLARLHARQISEDEQEKLKEKRRWANVPRVQRRKK